MDPWPKGDYSRHIREAVMVVDNLPNINPTSGRVLGQGLLAIPISGSRHRWYSGENRDTEFLPRVYRTGAKYRPKEGTRGGPTPRGGSLAWPPSWPPQRGWPPFGPLEPSFALIFYIFMEFSEHFKYW